MPSSPESPRPPTESSQRPGAELADPLRPVPALPKYAGVVRALDMLWQPVRRHGLEALEPARLQPALRAVCDEARSAQLYPEQLLWLLKESWKALPEVRRYERRYVADELLGRVVTMCIEEYFR